MSRARAAVIAGVAAMSLSAVAMGSDPQLPVEWTDAYLSFAGQPTARFRVTHRNFLSGRLTGGHADFGKAATRGIGRYMHIAAPELNADARPVHAGPGYKIVTEWQDRLGRAVIGPTPYVDAKSGDVAGSLEGAAGGAVTSSATLAQWFQDVAGVNTRSEHQLQFNFAGGGVYVYNGTLDTLMGVRDHDYTVEAFWNFVHEKSQYQFLVIETDADVWAYVDDKLVIDGGRGIGAGMYAQGLVVDGTVGMANGCQFGAAPGAVSMIATNATGAGSITMSGTTVNGDVMVGPGGNPSSAISANPSSIITGSRSAMTARFPIPTVTAPAGLPAMPAIDISGSTFTVNSSRRVDFVKLASSCTLSIQGHVTLYSVGNFTLSNDCHVVLQPNSSLQLYVGGQFNLASSCSVNANTMNPALVTTYQLSTQDVVLNSAAGCYMNLLAPRARVVLNSGCTFDGNVVAASAMLNGNSRFTCYPTGGAWGGGTYEAGLTPVRHVIEMDRLSWAADRQTSGLRVFFANRTGGPTSLRMETNMRTLGTVNVAMAAEAD